MRFYCPKCDENRTKFKMYFSNADSQELNVTERESPRVAMRVIEVTLQTNFEVATNRTGVLLQCPNCGYLGRGFVKSEDIKFVTEELD